MKNTRSVNVFYGHISTGIAFMFLGTWATTQYVAYLLGYQPLLGRPLLVFYGYPLYEPWQWFFWAFHFEAYDPSAFEVASRITYTNFFVMFAVMVLLAIRRAKRRKVAGSYGTARWATADELEQAGIFVEQGVILAQTNDAAFHTEVSRGTGEVQWKMDKAGSMILRHNGPEHIFCFAPTRSGKGVGLVIPTMLAWNGSVIAYDIKKELWSATAGWRRQFSHCWRFEPTAPDSVRFNPLLEIRKGEYEVRDVQNVADILVDPDGSKEHHDHWEKTGHSLLVGVILHVLYAEKDKSLSGVANFLSDPERSMYDTLNYMLTFPHLKERPHPVVAACAREMLNKTENELSGVVSTAMSFLGLYRDPFIARNTSVSDFAIHDLMNSEHPVSLYLVVPPSDIERTKPLMRLILNQFGRRLTEKIAFTNDRQQYRHRLLMMLDEFPSLGRLGFFESELAYMAGYGIKCVMIAQSLNQIEMAYGPNNSILDNSHVRITYGALDERTAKRISDLLGQATEKKLQMNFAGNRLSPWLGHIMESEQESPRPLLTPGEILQLPGDDALVMIGGLPPYRAKKIMYYQDERLMKRAWLPTPDDPEAQQSELLSEDCRHNPWLTDSGVAGQAVAEHQEHSDSQHGMKENVATPVAEQHDVTGEISVESAVPENTLLVEEPEITRTIDRANNRAGIIDLSRTPQGGHLPL
jgi:type IV secretion system protein VirD4